MYKKSIQTENKIENIKNLQTEKNIEIGKASSNDQQLIQQITNKHTQLITSMQHSHLFSDYLVSDSVNRSIRSINHSPTSGIVHKQRASYGPRLTLLNKSTDPTPLKDQPEQQTQQYIEKILLLSLQISRLNNLNQTLRKDSLNQSIHSSKLINGSKELNLLKDSNQTLKIAIKTLESSLMKSEQDKSKLKVSYESKLQQLQLQINNYAWKAQQNQKLLQRARNQNYNLELQLEKVNTQKTRQQMTQSHFFTKEKTMEAEKNYQIHSLKQTISKLQNQLNDYRYSIQIVKEENERLSKRETELLIANQSYANEFEQIKKRIDYDLTSTAVNTTLQSSDIDRYHSVSIDYMTLSRTVSDLEHELRTKDFQLTQKAQELRDKDNELEQKYDMIRQREEQIEEKDKKLALTNQFIRQKKEQIAIKQKQLTKKDNEFRQLNRSLRQKVDLLAQKDHQLRQKNDELRQKINLLRERDNEANGKHQQLTQTLHQLQQTKQYLQSTQHQFHQNQSLISQLRHNIAQLKQNNIDLRNRQEELSKQITQKQFHQHQQILQIQSNNQQLQNSKNQIHSLKQQLEKSILQCDLLKQIIKEQTTTIELKTLETSAKNLQLNQKLRKTQRKLKTAERLSTKNDTENIYFNQANANNNINSHNTRLFKSRSIESTSFFSSRKAIDFSLENIVTTTAALQGSNQRSMRLITRSQEKLLQSCMSPSKYKRKAFMRVNGDKSVQGSELSQSEVEKKTRQKYRRSDRKEDKNMRSSIQEYYGDVNA